jgi:hypothetical protein
MIRSLPLSVLTRTLNRWAIFNRRLRRLFGQSPGDAGTKSKSVDKIYTIDKI